MYPSKLAFGISCSIQSHTWCVQVLCASNEAHDKVEPVLVPEGVEIGERVSFEGFEGAPEPVLNPKKKLWEKIAPDLTTSAGAY